MLPDGVCGGFSLIECIASVIIAVVVTVAVSTLLLRFFRMHLPPALAVGLLPFVMTAPNGWYPVSVALGTSTLVAFFLGRGWLMKALTYARRRIGEFNA